MTEQGGEALYQVAVRALCEFSAKRGDLDLLARDDLVLELGDRVMAVVLSE